MNLACVKDCNCPNTECENFGRCCACVKNHIDRDGLPYCIFPNDEGSKSVENYYKKLKERFEP